jgi:hypothetical protein
MDYKSAMRKIKLIAFGSNCIILIFGNLPTPYIKHVSYSFSFQALKLKMMKYIDLRWDLRGLIATSVVVL